MEIYTILLLIWIHFFADFVFQPNNVPVTDRTKDTTLLLHVALYTIPFLVFGWKFALLNTALHTIVDWVTFKVTAWLVTKEKTEYFLVAIGLDQVIHVSALILTYYFMFIK